MFIDALLCKSSPVDAREVYVQKLLNKYDVKYENREKEGLIDLRYDFKKPILFNNVRIYSVSYFGDSGSLFYTVASGDMKKFIQEIGAKKIPKDKLKENGWGGLGQYFKETEILPTKRHPWPPIVIVGKDNKIKSNQFYFGCQEFDG